ncbi:MAG TPA: DUF551 domain-containing protein [Devosia sp.]|nr:DUF551 domain-containing protein [Devosia sp.]
MTTNKPPAWVPIRERLPELNQPVVIININRFENVGGDWERHIQDVGYLSSWGDGARRYWSIRHASATTVESYTHWLPLPAAPVADEEGQ